MPVTPSTRNYEEGERERQARMAEWSRLMTARSHPVDINAYRNLGMGGEITEGLQRGGGNIASMLGGLGNLASEGLGDRLAAYGAEVAARHPRSAEFQGRSIATDPSLLLSPRYLAGTAAEALPQFLPSLATGAGAAALTGRMAAGAIARGMSPAVARMLAGAAGTAVGGAPLEMGGVMNEAATLGKSREEQVNAALLAGAASIPLNLAGGAAIFSPARLLPRMGLSALTEGTTEGTEEEVQAAILGQPLGRSFPEAAIGGAILGPLGSAAYGGPSAAPPLAAQETLPEPSTLAIPPSLRPEGAPVAPTAPPASTPLTDRQEAILAHLAAINEPPPPPAAPPSPLQRLAGQPSAAAHTAAVPPVELFAEPSAAAHQAATQAPPMVPVYGTEGDLTGFRVVPQATPEISPFNATSMQAIQRALGIASFERDYGALSQPDAPVIPPQAAPAVQIPSPALTRKVERAGVPAGPFNTSMADALARARHAAPQPAAETFESLLENYLPPARAGRVPTTGTANARENMAAILSQAAQELRDRAAAIPAAPPAAKPQPAGDLNAPQDTQATPRDGGGVPREEQPRNPEGGRLRNAPLEGQPAPVQPVREEAGQGVPQAQVQQEAPKQEAVLAEPAAFKQEITLSERWDSAKLGKRVEWVRRAGWVTKKGGLSRLGEGISEGKWDGLSPAARNVLTPRIAEDYPALRTEPTAAGEQDIPPEKITTEVPQAETGFLPEARPEEAPTLPEASPGATEAAPAEAKTTTEPAQAEPPQVAETFAEDKEDVERAKEQLAREMADLARLKKNDPSFVNPYRTKEEGIRNAQSKIRDLRSEIRKKAPSDFENFATRPPDFGPVSSSKTAPKNSMVNAGEQYIATTHWFFKRGVFKDLDAREKTAGFNPDVTWDSLRIAESLDKLLRLRSSAATKLDGYVRFTDRTGAVLSNDNDTAVINSNYYDYIVKHAPKGGVEFRSTGEGTPVLIFHKGEAIGGVMPLTPPKGWANTLRSAKPTTETAPNEIPPSAEPTAEAAPQGTGTTLRAFTGVPSPEDVRALVKSTRAAFHWLFAQATAPTPAQSSVSSTLPGRPSPLRQATAPTPAQSSVLGTAGVNPSIFATDNRLARFIRDHNWSVLNIDPRLKLFLRQVRAGEHQTQAKTLTMVQGMMGLTEDDAVAMSAIIEGVPNGDYGVDQNAARERVEEDVNQIRAEIRRDEAELRELNMLDSTLEEGIYLSRVYDKKTKTFREIWNHPAVLGIKGGELSPRGTDTTVHVPESRRVTMDKGEMFDAESLAWDERVLAVRKNKGSDVYIIGRIKLSPTRQLFATPRTIGSKRGQRELDVRGIRHVAKDVYSVTLHRDYTTQERTGMGENRDARLRFAQGRLLVARDLAMGRLFKNIQDEAPDLWMDPDPDAGLPDGWHELPKSLGTRGGKVKRYGVLAGKWVHPDVYRLLTTHTGGRRFLDHPGVKRWRAVQGIWKRAKAPLAPVVHANNITTSAVQAFIGPTHGVLPGAKIYRDVFRDLRRGGPLTQKWRSHFADTDFLSAEGAQSNLRQEMESMFPRILEPSEPGSAEEGLGRVWGASLRGMERLYRVTGAKRYVDVASRLYRAEDFFFKMVIAENAVRHGLSVDRAVQEANDAIFDYTDMPPWAEGVRDFAIPFFAYSLKASHSLALSMASHPVRVAEVAGALWAMNLLGIMSDGSDFDEEKEARKVMPEWMRGYSALGTPAFIRIPRFGAERNQYFDVTRKLPLGDMFATHSGTGGLPWMRAIYPNNPVISMFQGLVANRDSFTGREVFNKSDDPVTRAAKAAEFTYRQLMPNLPFLPGTYAYDKVVNGLARDMGRPVLGHTGQRREGEETDGLLAATAHTLLGLNAREVNVKEERANRITENKRKAAAVKADMTRAKKDHTLTPERRQDILDRKRRQLGDLTQQKARLRAGGAP